MLGLNLNAFICLMPEVDGDPSVPNFTQTQYGEATENQSDEAEILGDQDVTRKSDVLADDENMGATTLGLEPLEDEPADFMRGEVDVKEEMDRTARAMDASIRGYVGVEDEDNPRTELGAAFRDTPGGIEEVEQKTDEDMARRHH